uniref:Bm1502, isoform b n=1 Tax=Brugia malayi TaxID=6279 RepID=A0A1I9G2C3_BRUMA|nr:Bm1502, isoform b [Brugia malayi]
MQLKITKATRPNCHPSSILLKYTTSTPKKGHDGRRPLYPTLTYSIPMVTTRFIGIMDLGIYVGLTIIINTLSHQKRVTKQTLYLSTLFLLHPFILPSSLPAREIKLLAKLVCPTSMEWIRLNHH